MGRKSKPNEEATSHLLSIRLQAQQFKPGIDDIKSGEQAFITAKSSAEKLAPEAQVQLIRHLEQNLDKQFTTGMMNPDMPGRERFPLLFEWYLERCLNRYLTNVCEAVKKDEEIETVNLSLVADRQALTFVLLLSAYVEKGALTDKEVHRVLILAYGLLPIILLAHVGSKAALQQLDAIQKLIYAERYGLQVNNFEKILGSKHTFDASVARGMEISKLLGEVSWLVKRADGSRFLATNNDLVKLIDDNTFISLRKDLAERIREHLPLLPTPTLENLAISLYNESLGDDNGGKELKKLKADLRAYEKWCNGICMPDTPGSRYGCDLPIEEYTRGWRKRKPGSGGRRPEKIDRMEEL
jgi:hypothetical protein